MKPYVKNQRTEEILPAVTRELTSKDSEQIATLYAAQGMGYEEAKERGSAMLQKGRLVGIFACGELCAVCAVLSANGSELVRFLDFGMKSIERCVVLEGLAEHPDYHTNGLEREVVTAALRLCWNRDLFFAVTAVKPSDRERLMMFMSIHGMRLRTQARISGCHLHYLLLCMRENKRLYTDYNRYSLEDTYGITKAMEDGYEGIATFRSAEGDFVWLAK